MADITARHQVFISVGSNLGDKLENCLGGIDALTAPGLARLAAVSRFYRTSPVDYTDQDWFVNAAVKIETDLDPQSLLDRMMTIQRQLGRKRDAIRFGPRLLDLDILLYDDRTMATQRLEIPHPRMHKRAFVLQPICDIDATVVHPVLGRTIGALRDALDDETQAVVPLDPQPNRFERYMA